MRPWMMDSWGEVLVRDRFGWVLTELGHTQKGNVSPLYNAIFADIARCN